MSDKTKNLHLMDLERLITDLEYKNGDYFISGLWTGFLLGLLIMYFGLQ